MVTLQGLFPTDIERNINMRALMLKCQTNAQLISAVCVGAGDAFINRYWPLLQMKVTSGRVKLTIADEKPLKEVVNEKLTRASKEASGAQVDNLERRYTELTKAIESYDGIQYINLEDDYDRKWFHHMTSDIVFILVPDKIHIREAMRWQRRATLVFIEKPYNRDLLEADEFERDLREMERLRGRSAPLTLFCPFDHYLAKMYEYQTQKEADQITAKIGALEKIEFGILEHGPVEPWRAEALKAGLVHDLFSHILALLSLELKLSSFDLRTSKIKIACHDNLPKPFEAETFAGFETVMKDYLDREVTVKGAIGKGVGRVDDKFLRLYGRHGCINCDLGPNGQGRIKMVETHGKSGPLYTVGKGHEEFLSCLFAGRYMEEPIGGLSGEVAIEILRILTKIRQRLPTRIQDVPKYPPGELEKDAVWKLAQDVL